MSASIFVNPGQYELKLKTAKRRTFAFIKMQAANGYPTIKPKGMPTTEHLAKLSRIINTDLRE